MSSPAQDLPEGTVTVLSTDLVGSTQLNQRLGDEAAGALERQIEHRVLDQLGRHRGVVIKDTGDGLMAAFQSARRAVSCAQEIQRAMARIHEEQSDKPLQMRIGLHTGEVFEEDGNLKGETVIIAKRIEGIAPSGGIFASETVHGVLGTSRSLLEDRGEFELKGIEEPWHLFEVPWVEEAAEQGVLAASERTPYVGRGRERARLRELAVAARDGTGSLVLLAGEAGVGKSRLAEETAEEARRLGFLVLSGHCTDMDGPQPYLPLIEQIEQALRTVRPERLREALGANAPEVAKLMPELRQRYPDIPEPIAIPPEQERRYLLHGVSEFIEHAARIQPMLLIYEDLHWADESTLALLGSLAQRLHEMPVFVIGTYRHTELAPGRPLSRVLQDFLRERLAEEILLDRFTQDGVTEMLERRAGSRPPQELVALVYSKTEGNPFFVEEVFRHLNEAGKLFDEEGRWRSAIHLSDTEVPRGVGLIIGQRLDRVSEACRRALTSAAVVGRVFGFDLLSRFANVDEDELLDALEEAGDATLIEDASQGREARYAFVHEQIRQTLLSTLSFPRRQRLHLRIANALEQLHGAKAERNPIELAHHLYQAGAAADPERTARYLVLSGQHAMTALAFDEALRHFDAARTVLPEEDREGQARLLCSTALALRGAARIDESLQTFADALALAPSGAGRNRILFERAQLRLDLWRGQEALEDLRKLLAHARETGDRERELEVLIALGRAHYVLSSSDPAYGQPARESYEEAYALAKKLGDLRAMARALVPTHWFVDYWRDYREQARANIAEATRLAEELGDEDLAIDCATARLAMGLETPAEAAEEAEALRERLEARRDPIRLNAHYFWLMWHYWGTAQLERCVETCDAGIALAAQLGTQPVQYPTIKALALVDLGRFDKALVSLEGEVSEERFGYAFQQLGEAYALYHIGALGRAVEKTRHAFGELRQLNRQRMYGWMVNQLTTLAARGAYGRDELAELLAETGLQPSAAEEAELALATGRADRALELAGRASEAAERNGRRRDLIRVLELKARILTELERRSEAIALAGEALAHAEETGYRTLAWRIRAVRAHALAGAGDPDAAARDLEAARETLKELSGAISDRELRSEFEAEPLAAKVLGGQAAP
ncbi:MAG: AAA family ATPase [Myxococcota bacterium]